MVKPFLLQVIFLAWHKDLMFWSADEIEPTNLDQENSPKAKLEINMRLNIISYAYYNHKQCKRKRVFLEMA